MLCGHIQSFSFKMKTQLRAAARMPVALPRHWLCSDMGWRKGWGVEYVKAGAGSCLQSQPRALNNSTCQRALEHSEETLTPRAQTLQSVVKLLFPLTPSFTLMYVTQATLVKVVSTCVKRACKCPNLTYSWFHNSSGGLQTQTSSKSLQEK